MILSRLADYQVVRFDSDDGLVEAWWNGVFHADFETHGLATVLPFRSRV